MSVIKYIMKIGAFIAGLFVVLNFINSKKEDDKYILLNAEHDI